VRVAVAIMPLAVATVARDRGVAPFRAELAETDPMVSPIHGPLNGLWSITMFNGTRDILNADAHRLVALAASVGHPLEYHEGAGMIYNDAILPRPEGDGARAIIMAAIRSAGTKPRRSLSGPSTGIQDPETSGSVARSGLQAPNRGR